MAIIRKGAQPANNAIIGSVEGKVTVQGLNATGDVVQEAVVTSDNIKSPFQNISNLDWVVEGGAKILTAGVTQYLDAGFSALGDVTGISGHNVDYKGAPAAQSLSGSGVTGYILSWGTGTCIFKKTVSGSEVSVKVGLDELSYPFIVQDGVTYELEDNSFLAGFTTYTDAASGTEYAPNTLFPGETKEQDSGDSASSREYFFQSGKGTAQVGDENLRLNKVSYTFFVDSSVDAIAPNNNSVIFGFEQTTI